MIRLTDSILISITSLLFESSESWTGNQNRGKKDFTNPSIVEWLIDVSRSFEGVQIWNACSRAYDVQMSLSWYEINKVSL